MLGYLFAFFKFYTVVCQDGKVLLKASFFFKFYLPGLNDLFVSKDPREFHDLGCLGWILICACTICLYGQISISCTIPSESPSRA